jgi:hypothetical protein
MFYQGGNMSHNHCQGHCHGHDHHGGCSHGSCSAHGESCEGHHHECCGECGHHHPVVEKDFAHQLLEMADEAWMEILKDKIKSKILESSGAHLDQLAKLVSDSNKERWKHKIAGNAVANDYRDKFSEFFDHA